MSIKNLSNQELENTLKTKTASERQLTVEIISLLAEVNSRRLYLQRGFGSIIEYCIKELNYSESSAYRRISAMRIMQEVPQVKEALATGRINLVNVAQAQTVFKKEAKNQKPLSCVEKAKVLESLENQSSRQAEKILLKISPEQLPNEKMREISPTHTQVTLVFSEELMQKLSELKSLLSHKIPNPSTTELIGLLADMALKKLQPTASNQVALCKTSVGTGKPTKRVYISKSLRQTIWHSANSKCQYRDPISERHCESKFQLQIEHKNPVAKGGNSGEENLELICAAHNRLRAIEHFGRSHMSSFLKLQS